MKKIISMTLALALIMLLGVILLASCASSGSELSFQSTVVFGEKYIRRGSDENEYSILIFYRDGTGEYRTRSDLSEYSFGICSGTAYFEWRIGSDNMVHLFKTKVEYNDEHNSTQFDVKIPDSPLVFGMDFFGYQDSTTVYVREGSKLEAE